MPGLAADCDSSLIIDSQSHLTHLFVMTLRDLGFFNSVACGGVTSQCDRGGE